MRISITSSSPQVELISPSMSLSELTYLLGVSSLTFEVLGLLRTPRSLLSVSPARLRVLISSSVTAFWH
jgi:hypothetical protein